MSDKNKILNTALDTGIFYVANYAIHSPIGIAKPGVHHALIFGAADWLVRNQYIMENKEFSEFLPAGSKDNRIKEDAFISGLYLLASAIWDGMIDEKGVKGAFTDNLIRGVVGFGGNVLADKFFVYNEYR